MEPNRIYFRVTGRPNTVLRIEYTRKSSGKFAVVGWRILENEYLTWQDACRI